MNAKDELIEGAYAVARAASCVYASNGVNAETIKICERLDMIALELLAYVRRLK